MPGRMQAAMERAAVGLAALSMIDRLLKLSMLRHYFSRANPPEPRIWPSVTILQPITRGVGGLRANLEARARLDYPGHVQHILICDSGDAKSLRICQETLAAHPGQDARLICAPCDGDHPTAPAPKLRKLQAALPYARGAILCLMDDDVAPRRDNLRRLAPYLLQPGVGASYALACYTNWSNVWSSLLTSYVNTYSIENYVAWAYLCGPVRVTGQMACYWREPLVAAGGFNGLEGYIDDDFALAQRLQSIGLRPVQAPVMCDISDYARSWSEYQTKFTRWIVLPKQAMEPSLTAWQRMAAFLATPATILAPTAIATLTLLTRSRPAELALLAALAAQALSSEITARRFLGRVTPRYSLLALPYTMLVEPLHALLCLLGGNEIVWRGQRIRVFRDGRFTRVV